MESKVLEILQYRLSKGTSVEFHRIMVEISVPLHASAGLDVIAYGISLHDPDAYYLLRAFDSLEQLKEQQDRFYHTEKWQSGPRAAIIERIESSQRSVISLSITAVDALRTPG